MLLRQVSLEAGAQPWGTAETRHSGGFWLQNGTTDSEIKGMLFFAYVTCHILTCWYAYMMYCIYNIYQYIYLSKGMYIYVYMYILQTVGIYHASLSLHLCNVKIYIYISLLGSASQDSQWPLGHTTSFPCVWNENAKLRLHFLWKFWEGCIHVMICYAHLQFDTGSYQGSVWTWDDILLFHVSARTPSEHFGSSQSQTVSCPNVYTHNFRPAQHRLFSTFWLIISPTWIGPTCYLLGLRPCKLA